VSDHLRRSGAPSPLPEGEVGPSGPGEGLQPSPDAAHPLTLAALDLSPPGRGDRSHDLDRLSLTPTLTLPTRGRERAPDPARDPGSAAPSGMTRVVGLSQIQRLRARSVRCEPSGEIEGGVSCGPARWVMVVSVRAKLLVTGGSFQADLLRQRPRVGLPRPQVCETCGGTAPRPASATPRERAPHRTRMPVAIAELRASVKNKVRTLRMHAPHPLPYAGEGGPRVSEGRERGRAHPVLPLSRLAPLATLPRKRGEGMAAHPKLDPGSPAASGMTGQWSRFNPSRRARTGRRSR